MRLAQLDSALGSMRRKDMMRARFRQLVSPDAQVSCTARNSDIASGTCARTPVPAIPARALFPCRSPPCHLVKSKGEPQALTPESMQVGIVVARALPARHASLRPLFDFLDTDHSGSLTLQELREGLLDGQLQVSGRHLLISVDFIF